MMAKQPQLLHYQSVAQEIDKPSFSHVLRSSQELGWDSINVLTCLVDYVPDTSLIPEVIAGEDSIIMQIAGVVELSRYMDGRWKKGFSTSGVITLTPKKMLQKFRWTDSATNFYLHFNPTFLPSLAHQIGRGDPLYVEMIEQFTMRDPFIEQIIWKLITELQTEGLEGSLYVDILANTLGLHMLRNYSTFKTFAMPTVNRLTSSQMHRVKDYIEAHLTEKIPLPELAAYADVSASHFGRCFKASFGAAPHQYVIQRRLERAKQLLKKPTMTIAEAAHQVGFYDQSHLIRHFKRFYGAAPQSGRSQQGFDEDANR